MLMRLGRVPVIIGAGIVPIVANAPGTLGRVAHYWVSLGSAKRISTAMFEICPLMFSKQFYDAAPKPVGCIERFRAMTPKFALPLLAKGSIHLPATRRLKGLASSLPIADPDIAAKPSHRSIRLSGARVDERKDSCLAQRRWDQAQIR